MRKKMSSSSSPLRGQVFFVRYPGVGEKPAVVVSNNPRNRALRDVLVARISTAPKPKIASIVELPHGEPIVGAVLCDDLSPVEKSDLVRAAGGLSARAMSLVDAGLKVALAL